MTQNDLNEIIALANGMFVSWGGQTVYLLRPEWEAEARVCGGPHAIYGSFVFPEGKELPTFRDNFSIKIARYQPLIFLPAGWNGVEGRRVRFIGLLPYTFDHTHPALRRWLRDKGRLQEAHP